MKKALMLVAFAVFVGHPGGIAAQSASLAGMWDATVTVNGIEIPFRMEFSGAGSAVKGSLRPNASPIAPVPCDGSPIHM